MRKFIIGTDWWTDCDDALAMRILARSHKNNEIKIEGIGINACMEYSVASLEGFLNTEGVYDIPLGIDSKATDYGGNPPYQKRLSAFAQKYKSNDDIIDAVKLYRKILNYCDDKIEIIEIGYLQVIADVLQSQPDDISEKTGLELVAEKVKKIWVMAGKWDEENGKENNFARNSRSRNAANIFCNICPVPITFLGWEVGHSVISGGELEKDDILYQVLLDHKKPDGRSSWDPMLVFLAIIGDEEKAAYKTVCGKASVNAENGLNNFIKIPDGNHKYVIKAKNDDYYKNMINNLIRTI